MDLLHVIAAPFIAKRITTEEARQMCMDSAAKLQLALHDEQLKGWEHLPCVLSLHLMIAHNEATIDAIKPGEYFRQAGKTYKVVKRAK